MFFLIINSSSLKKQAEFSSVYSVNCFDELVRNETYFRNICWSSCITSFQLEASGNMCFDFKFTLLGNPSEN